MLGDRLVQPVANLKLTIFQSDDNHFQYLPTHGFHLPTQHRPAPQLSDVNISREHDHMILPSLQLQGLARSNIPGYDDVIRESNCLAWHAAAEVQKLYILLQ